MEDFLESILRFVLDCIIIGELWWGVDFMMCLNVWLIGYCGGFVIIYVDSVSDMLVCFKGMVVQVSFGD